MGESSLNDTSPEMEELYYRRLAELTPEERFARTISFMDFSRQMLIAGILSRSPNLNPTELRRAIAEATLPPELVGKWFPPLTR